MPNSEVINSLPQNKSTQGQYGIIAALDGSSVWKFLVMPTEISFERQASYGSSSTLRVVPEQQWVRTEGWTMSISNLPLSTYWEKKNLTPYVEAIASCQESSKNSAPPVLMFKWGSRLFSPCVMTRFSRTEKLWFPSGDLAEASISFTLLQVPLAQVVNV
jgi:hypothetical protein